VWPHKKEPACTLASRCLGSQSLKGSRRKNICQAFMALLLFHFAVPFSHHTPSRIRCFRQLPYVCTPRCCRNRTTNPDRDSKPKSYLYYLPITVNMLYVDDSEPCGKNRPWPCNCTGWIICGAGKKKKTAGKVSFGTPRNNTAVWHILRKWVIGALLQNCEVFTPTT